MSLASGPLAPESFFRLSYGPTLPTVLPCFLLYYHTEETLFFSRVVLTSTMPDPNGLAPTERSPLLGNPPEERERPAPESHGSAQNGSTNDVESTQQTEDTEDAEIVQGRDKVKSLLPILSVGIFMAFLDQSIVAAINGEIGSDLHALRNVSWIATAYFLTMTASQPLYGKLSDVFGRKPCLLFAYTMFGIGSLGCGVTKNMEGLIAARVSQRKGSY